ncbi:hypothetical protein HMPREF1008_01751 [Olsenella sp. oral taxon 809 str. F0356]|uniref:GNAT family N-acetyltransferase n=1 Tax=Olsenella sp. oral taxon 809 TaxID=661086 RepID=UPI000231EEF4|nr:GNAT family N-acetyltransferase [Olsenella sp. oral taxon 809]EHF01271.1 hypothetical protein HMPREF1008_01751 [Olsenella sp. oral taxon 809 str. F0356]
MTPAPGSDQPQISYRPFREDDFDDVTDICSRIWCSSVEGVYDRIVFGRVMTLGALQRSQHAHVAVRGQRVVGACFGGLSRGGLAQVDPDWGQRFADVMVKARKRAKLGGIEVEDKLFGRLRRYTMADVFISREYASSDAEVNLLVVRPDAQGRGIGSRLLGDMVARFDEGGQRGCFLVMGDDCDVDFMESRGFSLVQERRRAADGGEESVYLYGLRLGS